MAPRQCRWDAGVCKKKVAEDRARRGSPDPAARSTEGLPNGRNGSERTGDLRSGQAAGSGDPRRAQNKITGHWGEDAVGFKWTEQDSVDNRLQQMDVGRFYSATIWTPKEMTLKGIAVRIGEKSEASILFDTELLRVVCGWTGEFLEFNPARFGIIGPPKVGKEIAFHSPRQPGWSRDGQFRDPRPKPFGPLPREWAKYRGLHLHGDRVVFEYTVGPQQIVVLESPWVETVGDRKFFSRELEIAPSASELELLVGETGSKVELVADAAVVTLDRGDGNRPITAKVAPHDEVVTLKLLFPISANSASSALKKEDLETLRSQSSQRSLKALTQPGPARWTHEITTRGVVSDKTDALVVDTLTLPFDNPYKALMFVGGHDFFVATGGSRSHVRQNVGDAPRFPRSGERGYGHETAATFDAALCTLHGDVWLISGIDDKLEKLNWKRFATGLFQPLGLKIVKNEIYVVGRDQITRLHDLNGDGEADWYENFNNDGQVTANGHEYVTCLETDSQGWFYYLKGNANGATDHDGCLLRVSPDGQKLEVFATGFRNANGLGIREESGRIILPGKDIITVAPQEGEWTPGSAIFQVRQGGFYGYTPSAHRAVPPTDFPAPLCWIPRLQDNSSGGQVWIPNDNWGALSGLPLHLSYGTSQMFLLSRHDHERRAISRSLSGSGAAVRLNEPSNDEDLSIWSGATVPLPLSFESGVMRGRFRRSDEHLYVSGLRGWVSNAAKDGCLQRVRYTKRPLNLPVKIVACENGVYLFFTDAIDPQVAEDPDNYRIEKWNYRWSAAYGSPEFKASIPTQEGRDGVEVLSATFLPMPWQPGVFLELPDMQPVQQFSITMSLKSADGRPIERRIDATFNAINSGRFDVPNRPPKARPGQLAESEVELLVPGIRCEFVGQESHQPHVRRMAAWRFESHELGRTREIVASGYLVAPRRGKYRLSAECSSATEVFIGDQVVWRSTADQAREIELVRGYNRLRVVQHVNLDQVKTPVSLRLLWGGAEFETESVPPTALFCERLPAEIESLRLGRELFASRQCFRCHRVSDEVLQSNRAMPELRAEAAVNSQSRDRQGVETDNDLGPLPNGRGSKLHSLEAPDLTGVGSRLRGDWIAEWILNPSQMRSDARMPRLFSVTPTDEHRQQAADLAAYLVATLAKSVGELARDPKTPHASQAPRSGERGYKSPAGLRPLALWEDLGCLGCHRLQPQTDATPDRRTSLHFVRDKFLPGELVRYLREPQRHFVWTRMPDFGLSEQEATSLAQLLTPPSEGAEQTPTTRLPGDAARGQKLFASLGCRQCHRVSRDEPLPNPHLPSIFGKPFARGCLADLNEAHASRLPAYRFDPVEQGALLTLLRAKETTLANETATDISRRFVADLQCAVCHPRDGHRNLLFEVLADESETGLPPEVVPNLTWAGEKLHAPWIHSLLTGQLAERPRPWMKLRMPTFPARAHLLANGLAREHGLSSEPSPRPSIEPQLAEIGELLATRTGLLDCRQCHAIGPLPPTGDKSTLLAPGINFALTRERLRHDFYRRFTLDPPRYDVSTRMPKLAVDGHTTKVKDIFGGDARQQFEAVWHFLQTVPSATADP
ncbi:MAG: DUF6797 domain-containing protein [Planctomycetaceae bacterium]